MEAISHDTLKKLDYNAIKVPRGDIKPGMILGRRWRKMIVLGGLELLLQEDAPSLKLSRNRPTTDIEKTAQSKVSGQVEVGVLKEMLSWLGQKISALVKASRQKEVSLEFTEVSIDMLKARQLEVSGHLSRHSRKLDKAVEEYPALEHFADSVVGKIYLVTEVLKSANLKMSLGRQTSGEASATLPETGPANVKMKASAEKDGLFMLNATCTEPLVFAFKCHQLKYDKKKDRWDILSGSTRGLRFTHSDSPDTEADTHWVSLMDWDDTMAKESDGD